MALTISGSVVTTAAAYVTAAEVKSFLGISGTAQDTVIGYLITAMQNVLNNALGVDSLALDTYTDERMTGSNDYFLIMKHYPVVGVTVLKELGTSTDTTLTGWTVHRYETKRVYFDTFFSKYADYLVTYSAGYSTIPTEIKMALSYMIGGALSDDAKMPGVSSYSILGKSLTFRSPGEYRIVDDIINRYLGQYKHITIRGV